MSSRLLPLTAFIFATALGTGLVAQSSLCTRFDNNSGTSATGNGAGNFFDLTVLGSAVEITSIDGHLDDAGGGSVSVEIWTTPGTYVGSEFDQSVWTLQASGTGTAAGNGTPTSFTLSNSFALQPGTYGVLVYYVASAGGIDYNNTGSTQQFANADLMIDAGAAISDRFAGSIFTPRIWNGCIYYQPAAGAYAGFVADNTSPNGTSVNFTDTSFTTDPGGITAWAWDLDGDGSIDSTAQNPGFIYPSCGLFSVSLTVTDANGSDTLTRDDYIQAIFPQTTAAYPPGNFVGGTVANDGAGCPPSPGTPMTISVAATPMVGGALTFDLADVPASGSAGAVLLGATPLNVPLDVIGATGCTLLVDSFVDLPATLTPPTGTATIPTLVPSALTLPPLAGQGAVIAIGENPFGAVFSDRVTFTVGDDLSGITDPSTLAGLVAHFEGTNTFIGSTRAQPFFNIYNNSQSGETILSVSFDFQNGGPQVAANSEFDLNGLSTTEQFDLGNAQSLDMNCAPNTYYGSDVTTGLVYANTVPAACAANLGATTGWVGAEYEDGVNPRIVCFSFTSFGPGAAFGFEADIDGGPLGADGLNECLVVIQTDQRTVSGQLVVQDADTALQAW